MRTYLYILIVILCFSRSYGAEQLKDEIVFFNVGQGHAALVNKVGRTPLLIDAGSTSRPYVSGEMYEWTNEHVELTFVSQIGEKILDYWKNSNAGSLAGGQYNLNIIITHPDKDHKDFVPNILIRLREASQRYGFLFFPHVLLGGNEFHYADYALPGCDGEYSSSVPGLHTRATMGNFYFLESSGCITHLFCPNGGEDTNRWSIVIRLEIDGISAMLTGDADSYVKEGMLQSLINLEGNERSLTSDILLAPHHGSDVGTYFAPWDQAVNPKAIVIGAAPNKSKRGKRRQGNLHPRGEAILNFLHPQRRIWENTVMSHCVLYNCNQEMHRRIQGTFGQRLFDLVPNPAVPSEELERKWHVVWVNIPLYTLWTTGTLIFRENVNTPQFVDATNGLMTYIAVREFKYLLEPALRDQNPLLVKLLELFLAGGEGNREELTRLVENLSTQHTPEIEREGILLTGGLSLYESRANILRTLLSIPPEERQTILDIASPLLYPSKNISSRYRILHTLRNIQTEQRPFFIEFLRNHHLLVSKDANLTAMAMEIFSQTTLEQAQEILETVHSFFPAFNAVTLRERISLLSLVKAVINIERTRRETVFEYAQPFLMAHQLSNATDNRQHTFHDVDNNASLISIFASLNPENIPEFSQYLREVWSYLMADQLSDLYGENKHYCIKGLLNIQVPERLNFLREILPTLSIINQKSFESWVVAAITEKLSNIYQQPHFQLKLRYLLDLEANRHTKEESVFHPENIEQYLSEFNIQ